MSELSQRLRALGLYSMKSPMFDRLIYEIEVETLMIR